MSVKEFSSARGPVRAPARETAKPIGSVGLGRARGFSQEPHGLYPTVDAHIMQALVQSERFEGGAWECACGFGDLSRALLAAGIDTVSTDLIARGYGRGGVDFLRTTKLRRPNVATNPPFDYWKEFAAHALALGAEKVALLGRVLLIEDWDDRAEFFRQTRLSRIVMAGRGQKMRAAGTVDRGFKGMIAYAWYVWDRAARWFGGPVVRWPRPDGRLA